MKSTQRINPMDKVAYARMAITMQRSENAAELREYAANMRECAAKMEAKAAELEKRAQWAREQKNR